MCWLVCVARCGGVFLLLTAAALAAGPAPKSRKPGAHPPRAEAAAIPERAECDDGKLGSAITWADSVAQASRQAQAENKLLFVIHVSGDFRKPEFT